MTTQDPIFIYTATVTTHIPTNLERDCHILMNLSHGYVDGKCNFVDNEDGGKIKGKKEDPALMEASYNLHRGIPTFVYVSVFRDGVGKVGFEVPSKKKYKEVYQGFFVPRDTLKLFNKIRDKEPKEEDLWETTARSESRGRYVGSTGKSYGGFLRRITPRTGSISRISKRFFRWTRSKTFGWFDPS